MEEKSKEESEREQMFQTGRSLKTEMKSVDQKFREIDKYTHTQCVFHIIRLRLIIFHTPKNFNGRNKIE